MRSMKDKYFKKSSKRDWFTHQTSRGMNVGKMSRQFDMFIRQYT